MTKFSDFLQENIDEVAFLVGLQERETGFENIKIDFSEFLAKFQQNKKMPDDTDFNTLVETGEYTVLNTAGININAPFTNPSSAVSWNVKAWNVDGVIVQTARSSGDNGRYPLIFARKKSSELWDNWIVQSGSQALTRVEITSSGNWICPENVYMLKEVLIMGGGGGRTIMDTANAFGAGGGGGYFVRLKNVPVVPGTAYPIVIGAGGASGYYVGSGGAGSQGLDGGSTTAFDQTAEGGQGASGTGYGNTHGALGAGAGGNGGAYGWGATALHGGVRGFGGDNPAASGTASRSGYGGGVDTLDHNTGLHYCKGGDYFDWVYPTQPIAGSRIYVRGGHFDGGYGAGGGGSNASPFKNGEQGAVIIYYKPFTKDYGSEDINISLISSSAIEDIVTTGADQVDRVAAQGDIEIERLQETGLVGTRVYVGQEFSVTPGSLYVDEHNLNLDPKKATMELSAICLSDDAGFKAGNVVKNCIVGSGANNSFRQQAHVLSANTASIRFPNTWAWLPCDFSTGAYSPMPNYANWAFFITIYY